MNNIVFGYPEVGAMLVLTSAVFFVVGGWMHVFPKRPEDLVTAKSLLVWGVIICAFGVVVLWASPYLGCLFC